MATRKENWKWKYNTFIKGNEFENVCQMTVAMCRPECVNTLWPWRSGLRLVEVEDIFIFKVRFYWMKSDFHTSKLIWNIVCKKWRPYLELNVFANSCQEKLTLMYTFRRRFKIHLWIWVKVLTKIHFSYLTISLNTSSAKWRQHCLRLNVLTRWDKVTSIYTEIKCKRHWQIHFQIQMTRKKWQFSFLKMNLKCRLQNGGRVILVSMCKDKKNCCHFQDDILKFMCCLVVLSIHFSHQCVSNFQIKIYCIILLSRIEFEQTSPLHGKKFHITGPMWGESIGHWWIPWTKGKYYRDLIFLLMSAWTNCLWSTRWGQVDLTTWCTFDVSVMRNLTEQSIAAAVCHMEIKRVTDLTDEQGTKPIQFLTSAFAIVRRVLGKKANGSNEGIRKWYFLPAFDPFCQILFAHINYWCREFTRRKCYQQQKRIYRMR